MAVDHYENFPVASVLLPAPLREPVAAIYGFARSADDFADEGHRPPADRLMLLSQIRLESEDTEALVVLAHDPGLHELVIELSGNSLAADPVRSKFPTNAFAVFAVTSPWSEFERGIDLMEVLIARGQ